MKKKLCKLSEIPSHHFTYSIFPKKHPQKRTNEASTESKCTYFRYVSDILRDKTKINRFSGPKELQLDKGMKGLKKAHWTVC